METMRIGLLGGTFDPPHFGHLNLAISIKEAKKLDRVIFIPAAINPFKGEPTPASDRLELLKLLIDGIEGFSIDPCEIDRGGTSYTIDTVRKFEGGGALFLLLGEDQLGELNRWKEVDELFKRASPLVGRRAGTIVDIENLPLSEEIKSLIKNGLVDIPLFDISATEIRKRLKSGLYCGHLLPSSVLDKIKQNHLYYYPLSF